jgi:hypothetical protein
MNPVTVNSLQDISVVKITDQIFTEKWLNILTSQQRKDREVLAEVQKKR